VALDSANVVGGGARTFGIGTAGCVDIADAPIEVTGVVLGAGPYWVTGSLNDFGFQEDFPPGSLWALDADLAAQTAVIVHRLDIAAGDYTPSIAIDLNFAVPLSADAAAPGPNSCADFATDAGAP
jgi:hypothetical protein